MSARDTVNLTLCPWLTRIVLGVTFLWVGIPKFQTQQFSGSDAQALIDMGVVAAPVNTGAGIAESASGTDDGEDESPADAGVTEGDGNDVDQSTENGSSESDSSADDQAPEDSDADAGQPAVDEDAAAPEDDEAAAVDEVAGETEEPQQPATEEQPAPAGVGPVEARGLHGIAIMLHGAGHPYPVLLAWIAAATEALGGALILLGLLSRVWGLGLAIAMAYAFYLTSWPVIGGAFDAAAADATLNWYEALRQVSFGQQKTALWQLALFVMGLNIFIGGPGPISVDRLLFGPRRTPKLITEDL